MKRLVLAGAGGFGREVFGWAGEAAPNGGSWSDVVFVDDNPSALRASRSPGRLVGTLSDFRPLPDDRIALAFGDPESKKKAAEQLAQRGAVFETLRHPSALVGFGCVIGNGCILCPGAIVTADATLGDFVTLNVYATVGHDARIGDYSTLSGHADVTGWAILSEGVFMGTHAAVAPRVRVGPWAVVGAGTAALRDVEAGATVLGVPGSKLGVFRGGGRGTEM